MLEQLLLEKIVFFIYGPKLFNMLPFELRSMSGQNLQQFKNKLDLFLDKIPDNPRHGELIPFNINLRTGLQTNSLADCMKIFTTEEDQIYNTMNKLTTDEDRIIV